MSGHSKWANIRVKKTAEDKKRSAIFTKVAKNIRVAVKMGGGVDPKNNSSLRAVIERAREANMPKENIERILKRFSEAKNNLDTYLVEGYGPGTIPIIVEIETDNKIRTTNEIRMVLVKNNGVLGESNSVMYMFDKLGRIELGEIKETDWEKLIDFGAEDIKDNLVYVHFDNIGDFCDKAGKAGFEVIDRGVFFKPKTIITVSKEVKDEFEDLVAEIEENDDVLAVFSGLTEF